MKLTWCPDTASKSYLEAVRMISTRGKEKRNVGEAELIAAMAGGWKAQVAVEVLKHGTSSSSTLSTALSAAMKHTNGKVVNEEEEEGVDFMVVDMSRRDCLKVMGEVNVGSRGMVVVCVNVEEGKGRNVIMREGIRIVRKTYLPIGGGVEILHIGVTSKADKWFSHVDKFTGEEHLFKRVC